MIKMYNVIYFNRYRSLKQKRLNSLHIYETLGTPSADASHHPEIGQGVPNNLRDYGHIQLRAKPKPVSETIHSIIPKLVSEKLQNLLLGWFHFENRNRFRKTVYFIRRLFKKLIITPFQSRNYL